MAELAAGFLGPAIEVVKWFAKPIIRQLNYLCCFTSNINSLKDEAGQLENVEEGLQGQVDRASENLQIIVPEVRSWLKESKDIKDHKNAILDEVPNVKSGCLKLRARFSLSRRAKKTTDRMKELRDQCKFDPISQPGPPAATQVVPLGMAYEFESRKEIEEDIMKTLRDGDVNIIGICGMGGLGKTTMAQKIMNKVLKEHIFEEVVMAVVSQEIDEYKIQVEIGGSLGLSLKEDTSQARVQKLYARLSDSKKTLLVLDDVWRRLKLEDFGIPCESKGCTILLTSRNSDALRAMNVQKIVKMKVLSEEDALFLFKEAVGTCVDDTNLASIAKEVVKECKGLPIALTTVGAALRDENNVSIWNNALRGLRQCDPDIPDFIAEVYNPLKLSYNVLSSKHKLVFLLCCLFHEDANISLDQLTYFCNGLGVLGGIRNLKEARDRVCALTEMLKSRSLLLDGYNKHYVRMHDVVRDVCIFIARQEGYVGGNDCTWISSFQLLGERIDLPQRRLFLIRYLEEEQFRFDKMLSEGIRDLYVLCMEKYSLTSLPHTTESLKNLNTLLLYSCKGLRTISVVGQLVDLEILICRNCGIWKLPEEIKGLKCLKLLDLTGCGGLQRIGRGIISSLVGLEELKMFESFDRWEAEDREEKKNASIKELEALTNLACLEIDIHDPSLVAENIHLSSKIERFQIRIPGGTQSLFKAFYSFHKKMSLKLEGETCLGNWIEMMLRDTEYLHLIGYGANNVDLAKGENIKWLMLVRCDNMKNVVRTSGGDDATVFPYIEYMCLYSLDNLQEICDGPISSTSFQNLNELSLEKLPAVQQLWGNSQNNNVPLFTNLSSIEIKDCPRLCNLGQLSSAGKDCLPQLEILSIEKCEMMELVFLWNGEEGEDKNNGESGGRQITKMFPKLKEVKLVSLPNLKTFYQGIEGIEFPLLTTMDIVECPKMKSIVISSNANNSGEIDDDSSYLFCQPEKVSFGSLEKLSTFAVGGNLTFHRHKIPESYFNGLEELKVSTDHRSCTLFTSSVARNLVSLKTLDIYLCNEMIRVIEDDDEEATTTATVLFPKLEELTLINLPKLVTFCEWKREIELPSLEKAWIGGCPKMKGFSLGPITTYLEFDGAKDFNDALRQMVEKGREEEEEEEEEEEDKDNDDNDSSRM